MYVDLLDGSTTVDTNSISFALDGTLLATNITKSANITTVGARRNCWAQAQPTRIR